MKILIIDDDEELLELLGEFLSSNGLEVLTASSGKDGLAIIARHDLDLVVLDVMMPLMSGLDVLREIMKGWSHLPVIMLTARGDEVERILGLEMGADDYMVKPFSSRELLARINAMARRREKLKPGLETTGPSPTVSLDMKKRQALLNGEIVPLSSIEFDILTVLIRYQGIVMSRERILELSRGKKFFVHDRSIDIQISRLRQKLEKYPDNPVLIKTVWGEGYIYTGELG
jgi:two-component system, OmpR family, response regulator